MQVDTIKHNLFFTGGGSKINDLNKIVSTNLSINIKDIDLKKSQLLEKINIDRDFFSCYGAYQVLNKGFSSEAIGIPSKFKSEKNSLFARIFNIFS